MTTTLIPCKRPKVTIEDHAKHFTFGGTGTYHLATCHVPGCDWSYDAAVVSDAQDQAKWHRGQHRAAVPVVQLDKLTSGGYRASCQCRAIASDRPLTRTDAEAWIAHHLSVTHGLVTCP